VDSGVCFSPAALALLASIWIVIQGTIVTLFWLLLRTKDGQLADSKASEEAWKRVALRGTELAKYFGEKATAS
jgi:hypothetical protein